MMCKNFVLLLFLTIQFAASAHGMSISPPDHDCSLSSDRYRIGIRSWGEESHLYYGVGMVKMPFSFWPTLVIVCAPAGLGCVAYWFWAFRRRCTSKEISVPKGVTH
jgi:hypothetical protein